MLAFIELKIFMCFFVLNFVGVFGINDSVDLVNGNLSGNVTTDKLQNFISINLLKIFEAVNTITSDLCRNDSRSILYGLIERQKWAWKMFDSSAKIPVGLLHGSYYQLGNFDECLSVKHFDNVSVPSFQGQYCLANIRLGQNETYEEYISVLLTQFNKLQMRMSYNNTLHWSICVPSTCTSTDVQKFLSKLFNSIITYKKADVQVSSLNCYTDKYVPFDTSEIVYCSVIALFSSFVLVATIYDIVYRKLGTRVGTEEKLCHKIIISFSSIENVKKLLKYTPSSDTNLEFVFGIKVISMILIIGSHTLLFVVGGPVFNEDFYIESVTKPENAFLLNNPLFVDTFLLISGFLMSRLLLLELNKKAGNVNIFMLYVARYIRLTPAYAVMIGLYATILKRLGNGPLWNNKILIEYNRCVQSWWTNILYINNYVNDDNICMFQSWYLSVDTHLFLIAPLIIYPLWRWPRVGKVLLSLFTFTFGLIPFVITYRYKLDPTQMAYPSEILDIAKNYYFRFAYIKTHMRSLSYSIGLVMGYVVDQLQSSKTQLSKTLTYTSLTVCVTFGISAVYSITIFYLPNYTYDELESALYASLHKIAWSLCVGCIIVLCATNNLGTLKSFLSWPPFVPFSRLTYCAYLVNGVIELYSLGTLRSPTYLSIWSLLSASLAHVMLTFMFAFILSILFESPILGLEKIFVRKGRTEQS